MKSDTNALQSGRFFSCEMVALFEFFYFINTRNNFYFFDVGWIKQSSSDGTPTLESVPG